MIKLQNMQTDVEKKYILRLYDVRNFSCFIVCLVHYNDKIIRKDMKPGTRLFF